ncbi:MAG TPA: hypothetical protein DCM28_20045 [Phycisphaerales bacterium]|nr:hypothetical protein [Phycisphaerales bacterium]HCD34077.1 hypothetical protein [Phycisphaerales bacterium]
MQKASRIVYSFDGRGTFRDRDNDIVDHLLIRHFQDTGITQLFMDGHVISSTAYPFFKADQAKDWD